MTNSIYWHDYESFGVDPRRDRASQFAGIRTDEELNIIGEPLVIYCQLSNDTLPHPEACLITGITPRKVIEEGEIEADFIARIHKEFAKPGTCVSGYNNIRFDDELTRQLLYRNFYDPYEREWKNGNSRWDIIDMVRLCKPSRGEGINWPVREDGLPSFRLEELTAANDIAHGAAHDALSDVSATIELAKLIKHKQPRLYDYVYQLRNKKKVAQQLDTLGKKPVLHVSSMYPAEFGCLAMVIPVAKHPTDNNGVIVYDLRTDPQSWMDDSLEQIRARLFTRADEMPEGESRIPLKIVHINRCPVIAPVKTLGGKELEEYQIDLTACKKHWQVFLDSPDLCEKVKQAFAGESDYREKDPDFMIYTGGFFSPADKKQMQRIHDCTAQELATRRFSFADKRLDEMLFRYRARNYPHTLNSEEMELWQSFRRSRFYEEDSFGFTLQEYDELLRKMQAETTDSNHLQILSALGEYASSLAASLDEN